MLADAAKAKADVTAVREICATVRRKVKMGKARKACAFPGDKDFDFSQEHLDKYLPLPTSRIIRDEFNGRWQTWYRRKGFNASKSWGPEACEFACVKEVLARLWAHHVAVTGQKCPYLGLLDP